ncbi:sialomucin core protein 24 [Erpetoichthys calabaricus]|uniref:CD164 molecule, sialomucin n=1 Tax=Erpetoichthys calabaricus TaxID=27687 RepID=A0A8C4X2M9_ERPCA|nr:sialomucin core protein 24 [Erpetoichthys calabaricus]
MYWKILLSALTVLAVLGCGDALEGPCSNFTNCNDCLKHATSNETTVCVWVMCKENSTDYCMSSEKILEANCTSLNETCQANHTTVAPATTANTSINASTAASPTAPHSSTVKPTPTTTVHTSATSNSTSSPTAAPQKKNTFDAASFIGGIVLVLGLQAVIFFLYKFCKSKDRNYHTL